MKKVISTTATLALLGGGMLFIPQASLAETTSASMSLSCQATPSSFAGPQEFSTDNVTVNIDSPKSVRIGEEFRAGFSIDPVEVELPSLPFGAKMQSASRLKLDMALPAGVEFLGAEIDESKSNLKGMKVLQVDAAGNPSSTGEFLRVTSADNATIGNGPKSSRNSEGGIKYTLNGSKIDLRFPEITLRLKAKTPGEKALGVRTQGEAGTFARDENFLTMLGKVSAPLVGTIWAPVQCSPRTSASAPLDTRAAKLASVTVEDASEVALNLEATGTPVAGQPATLSARLEPAAEGTVEFASGSLKASAPVVDGVATADLTFPITGEHEVTASFQPKNSGEFKPATATTTVTVAGQDAALNVKVPENAPARSRVEVKATVAQGAEGTVRFRLGDATVTAKVDAGVATAELPTGPNPGQQEITAEFTPAPRSAFAAGTASAPITIDAVTGTTIELNADQTGPVRPGQPVSISATVTPAENTERAEGTVEFLIDGERITRTLEGHATSVEFTPDREGEFPVEAKFVPADDSQTPAEDVLTVQVKGASATEIKVDAPQGVEPLVEAPTTVTVTPAAAGTVTAVIDGRRISAEVQEDAGTATLPLVFPREGEFEVPITFTPANPADAKRAATTTTITVAAPAASDVEIALNGPAAAEKGQSTSYTATLTPQVGSQRNVTGFLEILIDGKPVTKNGETARIPVVEGIAEFDVLWNRAGAQELTAVFHNASGEEVSRTAKTVTVAGDTGIPGDGNTQNPGDGDDNQVKPGGSSSSAANPFAPLIDFFRMLWEWLTSLFSGGGSSSGSSSTPRD
ncbi:Ig-like domain-containing protein [Corynebacterium urealyticum]|uniref:Ig-like domain-containing protein n=1 Tax=Corynebacterium urealyticum TaxID=43771 RepID=UPI0002B3FAC2|nr:Ig-like domain-containing protein [Corynebacterium urealyticum]AGE37407.1 secreted protein [Corynebacterium urealyticum DSM 7111]QQB07238.1 Ig-like domain repeat protein [Corynebacterium urealyticum]